MSDEFWRGMRLVGAMVLAACLGYLSMRLMGAVFATPEGIIKVRAYPLTGPPQAHLESRTGIAVHFVVFSFIGFGLESLQPRDLSRGARVTTSVLIGISTVAILPWLIFVEMGRYSTSYNLLPIDLVFIALESAPAVLGALAATRRFPAAIE